MQSSGSAKLAVVLWSVMLTGCPSILTGGIEVPRLITTEDFCMEFKPIAWSRHDTPETQDQAVEFNRGWDALCIEDADGAE